MKKFTNKADTVTAGDYLEDCGRMEADTITASDYATDCGKMEVDDNAATDCTGCGCKGKKEDKKSCGCDHK